MKLRHSLSILLGIYACWGYVIAEVGLSAHPKLVFSLDFTHWMLSPFKRFPQPIFHKERCSQDPEWTYWAHPLSPLTAAWWWAMCQMWYPFFKGCLLGGEHYFQMATILVTKAVWENSFFLEKFLLSISDFYLFLFFHGSQDLHGILWGTGETNLVGFTIMYSY